MTFTLNHTMAAKRKLLCCSLHFLYDKPLHLILLYVYIKLKYIRIGSDGMINALEIALPQYDLG